MRLRFLQDLWIKHRTIIINYVASNWGDKLVTYKGATVTYTGANIKKVNGWTYSYGYNNLLTQATKGTSGTAGYEKVTFSYDALGRLYERVHTVYNEDDGKNHVEFFSCFWNGDKLVHITRYTKVGSESYTKTDKLHFYYDADGKPSHVHFNDTRFFYQYNLQGDVIGLLAGHHTQIVRYEYDAWGKVISITGDRKDNLGKYNPFRYRHYMYDDSVSLYYLKSRHYHPALCRFLQADTVLGRTGSLNEHNLYAYCKNTPIITSDPIGTDIIVITDTDGLSHMSLLIQDWKGSWFYFYWGADNSTGSSGQSANAINGVPGNGTLIYEKIDIKIDKSNMSACIDNLNTQLNSKKDIYRYEGDYEKYLYLDVFSWLADSYAKKLRKTQDTLVYNLLTNNCAQLSLEILGRAIFFHNGWNQQKAKDDLYKIGKQIVPSLIHSSLKRNFREITSTKVCLWGN